MLTQMTSDSRNPQPAVQILKILINCVPLAPLNVDNFVNGKDILLRKYLLIFKYLSILFFSKY